MTFDLEAAHKHCTNNRPELAKSTVAGCFYCLAVYEPAMIDEWIDQAEDTAICPKCSIDSVIGDAAGFPIDEEFLAAMHERWFEQSVPLDDPLYMEAFGLKPPLRIRISELFDRIRGR
jgi:hypothetical protein